MPRVQVLRPSLSESAFHIFAKRPFLNSLLASRVAPMGRPHPGIYARRRANRRDIRLAVHPGIASFSALIH
jgi:hypothetical protein